MLPNLSVHGLVVDATVSPNGKLLLYQSTELNLLDLTHPLRAPGIHHLLSLDLLWSPDSTRVALEPEAFNANDPSYPLANLSVATRQVTLIPLQPGEAEEIGGAPTDWLDNTHWAIGGAQGATIYPPPSPVGSSYADTLTICSLNVTNGKAQVLATIRNQGIGISFFLVSPDKRTAFFYNVPDTQNPGQPYTPLVARVDLTTGQVTFLPTIAQALHQQLPFLAWRPGTMQIAATVFATGQTDLFDLQHDSVSMLPMPPALKGLAVASWWPGRNDTLLLVGPNAQGFSRPTAGAIGYGPFTLATLTLSANGKATGRILTQHAMTFLSLGFVRTA